MKIKSFEENFQKRWNIRKLNWSLFETLYKLMKIFFNFFHVFFQIFQLFAHQLSEYFKSFTNQTSMIRSQSFVIVVKQRVNDFCCCAVVLCWSESSWRSIMKVLTILQSLTWHFRIQLTLKQLQILHISQSFWIKNFTTFSKLIHFFLLVLLSTTEWSSLRKEYLNLY